MAVTLKGQTAVYEGTSTDTKPTDADNNAIFKELDTGIRYYYDGTDWNEIPRSGGGGGGGTGTDNYNELNNKPSINGTTLSGNKSLDNLGIQAKLTFDSTPTEDSENPVTSGGVYTALATKANVDNAIQGIKVNGSTVNPDSNKVVSITVPTSAADVSALPDTTKYAAALSLTINSSTFVMTGQLKDQNGDNLGTAQTIDLPLESVVVGGSYNSQTKKVVLTLQNGNTIEFSVADLVSGLQTELSASNKLNPAYIDYDSTHRAVSDTEKSTWDSKQNALTSTQLSAVNSGITSADVEQITTNKNNISTITPALKECVDNGVKNKFNYDAWKDCGVFQGTKTINGNSFTMVANGDDCFTWYENGTPRPYPLNARIPCNAGDKVVFTWDYTPLSGQTNDRVGIFANGLSSTGFFAMALASNKKLEFTAPTGTTYFSIRFGLQVAGNSAIYGNIQIQSKASYDAGSTDYQPYAMSNAELTAAIQAIQAQLANQ